MRAARSATPCWPLSRRTVASGTRGRTLGRVSNSARPARARPSSRPCAPFPLIPLCALPARLSYDARKHEERRKLRYGYVRAQVGGWRSEFDTTLDVAQVCADAPSLLFVVRASLARRARAAAAPPRSSSSSL